MSPDATRAVACPLPADSAAPAWLAGYTFEDSYAIPLRRPDLSIQQVYLAIFAHHPWWAKALLWLRTRIVALFGIGGPSARELARIEVKESYAVGEKIALFRLIAHDEDQIIAGGEDKHLDFRVSVLRRRRGETQEAVVTTVVKTHNLFGRCYLATILPFHRFGVKYLMSSAAAAGRL